MSGQNKNNNNLYKVSFTLHEKNVYSWDKNLVCPFSSVAETRNAQQHVTKDNREQKPYKFNKSSVHKGAVKLKLTWHIRAAVDNITYKHSY